MDLNTQRKISKNFELMFQTGQKPWRYHDPEESLQTLFNKINREYKSAKILDIGCGDGWISVTSASHGFETWGIDSAETAIREAADSAAKINLKAKVHFKIGDALKLPYKENFFDVVIDRGLFHHVLSQNRDLYLKNVLRVLKKKSLFYLSVFSTKNEVSGFQQFSKEDIENIFGKKFTIEYTKEDEYPTRAPAHLVHFILKRRN